MAEHVLRAEGKDNSDGKTMFGLSLLISLNINMNIGQTVSLEIWVLITLTQKPPLTANADLRALKHSHQR